MSPSLFILLCIGLGSIYFFQRNTDAHEPLASDHALDSIWTMDTSALQSIWDCEPILDDLIYDCGFNDYKQTFQDHEPNYHQLTRAALNDALEHTSPVDLQFILRIHKNAMTDLQYGSEPASGHYIPGTFSNVNTMLSVTLSQEAILAYDELNRFVQQFGCQLLCSKNSWDIHHNIEHLHKGQQENIGQVVNHLLAHYHTEMKSIDAQLDPQTQQQQRLRHICHLIQQLERFHPFTDGNGRTFRNILLNSRRCNIRNN